VTIAAITDNTVMQSSSVASENCSFNFILAEVAVIGAASIVRDRRLCYRQCAAG
jgi:hypothetical protein